MASKTTRKAPIFIFDNPRTSSQLLNLFFAGHPDLDASPGLVSSWIWPLSVAGPERLSTKLQISPQSKESDSLLEAEMHAWYQKYAGIDINQMFKHHFAQLQFQQTIAGVLQAGKVPFSREHRTGVMKFEVVQELLQKGSMDKPPRNPTYIPDELFFSMRNPAILIRHPALVVPSYFRAQNVKQKYAIGDEIVKAWTMQSSAKFLYEHLLALAINPVVVDGDDVMYKSSDLCAKLCALWQLDPSGVRFEWQEGSEVEKSFPLSDGYMNVTFGSKGIVQREPKIVDIDVEESRWRHEFGEETAAAMRVLVDADLADYEYLKARKLEV
ncbi:hypothetical protein HII31_08136 [Pseudocercospora fuligena]|uniref:Sulfotransferase domain-containing protein n=1 Tax=Pseudocercospora fuligena TaxID=685502 RepID=A0A8H6VH97_9PEZI|nr:hypothetical protein HII31_08136 [Pseudocercospora fuligena]